MKNKKLVYLTYFVTLAPALVGLILWNQLPERMPIHFGVSGQADGWSGKTMAVFGLPVLMALFQTLMLGLTKLDRKSWENNEKIMNIVLWMMPVLSLVNSGVVYGMALNLEWNITRVMLGLIGTLFVALGNYLPKCKISATMGIKLKWTLYNEENWNKTHRFGGKCWVIAGLGFIISAFLPKTLGWTVPATMIAMVMLPVLYSWLYYKKQVREGTWVQTEGSKAVMEDPFVQKMGKWGWLFVAGILALVAVMLFSGSVDVAWYEDYFTVDASFCGAVAVDYADITSVEYRSIEGLDTGTREWGVASARLLAGSFRNEEFGAYIRYTYTGADSFAIVTFDDDVLVISGRTDAETEEIARTLAEKIA